MGKQENAEWVTEEIGDITYLINKDKKIVVGYMHYFSPNMDCIKEQLSKWETYIVDDAKYCTNWLKPIVFKAIAKCSPEDEFDADYGKKLVEARLWKKYHKRVMKDLFAMEISLNRVRMKIMSLMTKHAKKYGNIDNDLKNYFKVGR